MNDDKRKWHTELTSLVAGRLVERINVAGIELKGSRNIKKKRGGGKKFSENFTKTKILGIICICRQLLRYYCNSIIHYRSCAIKKCLKKKSGEKWVEERVILRQLLNCDRHCESLLRRYR